MTREEKIAIAAARLQTARELAAGLELDLSELRRPQAPEPTITPDAATKAARIIATGRDATAGPWISAPDCVATLDPERVAAQHEECRKYAEERGRHHGWTYDEIAAMAARDRLHYGGGDLICESIRVADREFVAACRDAPEVAARMLELEGELAAQIELVATLGARVAELEAGSAGPAEPRPRRRVAIADLDFAAAKSALSALDRALGGFGWIAPEDGPRTQLQLDQTERALNDFARALGFIGGNAR